MQAILSLALLSFSCAQHGMRPPSNTSHREILKDLFAQFNQTPLDETSIEKRIHALRDAEIPLFHTFDKDGNTILLKAVSSGSLKLTTALLAIPHCRSAINKANTIDTYTPLAIAIQNHYHAILQLLIDYKVHPGIVFRNQQNLLVYPFTHATTLNNIDTLRLLIHAGAHHFPLKKTLRTTTDATQQKHFVKKLLLNGVPYQELTRVPDSSAIVEELSTQSSGQPLEELMFAFSQRTINLRAYLASNSYQQFIFKKNDYGLSLFDLIENLTFDQTRIRPPFEERKFVPVWQDQALCVGRVASRLIMMLLRRIHIAKDLQLPILSQIIGSQLLLCMQQDRTKPKST